MGLPSLFPCSHSPFFSFLLARGIFRACWQLFLVIFPYRVSSPFLLHALFFFSFKQTLGFGVPANPSFSSSIFFRLPRFFAVRALPAMIIGSLYLPPLELSSLTALLPSRLSLSSPF